MATRRPLVLVGGTEQEMPTGDTLAPGVESVSAPAWAASTAYRAGELVWQGGALYRRIADGTSGTTFDPAQWTLIGPSAGGGGGTDMTGRNARPTFILPRINDWVVQAASTVQAVGNGDGNLLVGAQFLPAGTYAAVGVHLNDAGSTGSLYRIVAYADDNGRPTTLLADCGTFNAASANGFRTITTGFSLVVPDGGVTIWSGGVAQGAASTTPKVFQVGSQSFPYSTSQPPLLWSTGSPSFSLNGVTGAPPADLSAAATTATASYGHPRIAWRRTA